jgi:hypothetical protein
MKGTSCAQSRASKTVAQPVKGATGAICLGLGVLWTYFCIVLLVPQIHELYAAAALIS